MEALQVAISSLKSGPRLLGLIREAGPRQEDLANAIQSVLRESAKLQAVKENQGSCQAPAGAKQPLGQELSRVDALFCINPRGKQDLLFFSDHLVLHSAKADLHIPYAAVHSVAVIDKIPKDTKQRVLLYLHLKGDAGIRNGKQPLTAVVMQTTASMQLDIVHPKDRSQRLKGSAPIVLCQALGTLGMTSFCSPSQEVFQSASGDAGIEAVVKVNQGVLFPMKTALCFLERPATFIPLLDVRSVEFGRATGGSSTFDFFVHLASGVSHEFSNISRAELARLMQYVADRRLRVGTDDDDLDELEETEGAAAPSPGVNRGAEDDDSDDEDSDFDPERGESDDDRPQAKRSRREAGPSTSSAADQESDGDQDAESSDKDDAEGSGSEDDSDDDGSEVEVESEEDVPAAAIRSLVDEAKQQKKRRRLS